MKLPSSLSRKPYHLAIAALALIALPVSIYLARTPTRTNSNAATGNSVLSIQPAQSTPKVGDSTSFAVSLNPNGDQVNSVELHLTYNASVIEITDIQPGNFFTDFKTQAGGDPVVVQKIFGSGDIRYAIGFPLGSNYGGVVPGAVATILYKVNNAGTSNLVIDTTSARPSLVANLQASNTLASATNGTITVNTDTPTLSFTNVSPAAPQVVNRNFTVDSTINSAGEQLSGVDAKITFNPLDLKVVSVDASSPSAFSSYPSKAFDNTAGTITIAANIGTSSSPTPASGSNLIFARIAFQPLRVSSSTQIAYTFTPGNSNDSNLVKYNAGDNPVDILAQVTNQTFAIQAAPTATLAPTNTPTLVPTATRTPTPTPTSVQPTTGPTTPTPTVAPSPTPTVAPTPTPTLTPTPTRLPTPTATPTVQANLNVTLQINFQGKGTSGISKNLPITISLKNISSSQITQVDAQTNTSGQASIAVVPGNYSLIVKSSGYLAKRFGTQATPVAMNTNGQLINLTATPLLGGDFNNDGEVNEIDYTLHILPNFYKNYPLADLDRSGELNALDFAIMRDNWNKQDDSLQ